LAAAREKVSGIDSKLRERDTQRAEFDQGAQVVRTGLDDVRLQRQEVAVRRDTISEQVERDYDAMLEMSGNLAEELDEDAAMAELESVAGKIERIGPVNLVAIEEYEECSERKVYLDNQNADLTEALTVLEDVISKMDEETRARFKDTFDKLNLRFKEFFPKLFGGGSAYLEMTGDNLLDAGVTVMARPPGKRNSTIHLLSGGEKALAAVSLLFGFFDLNPAPFCVLDEVDAPLDDANVERYTEVLKSLAERTQLLFITHNKITMEASDILIGVTMAEPGVSNLVSVDVEEAVSMATQ
jgi:chromosome segregation protein